MLYFIVLSSPTPVTEVECENTICKGCIPKEIHSSYSSKYSDIIHFKIDPCKNMTDADEHEVSKEDILTYI